MERRLRYGVHSMQSWRQLIFQLRLLPLLLPFCASLPSCRRTIQSERRTAGLGESSTSIAVRNYQGQNQFGKKGKKKKRKRKTANCSQASRSQKFCFCPFKIK